jgi:hypothetical protein
MTMHRRALFVGLAIAGMIRPAAAQSVTDIGARLAPQFFSYTADSPSNLKISEFALPLFVIVPVAPSLTFDVGTAYAQARVQQTAAGQTATSSISGLTDTQVRANYVLGTDFVVLTAGVNLPTGQSKVTTQELPAASLIGSDFLSFPISNMGTGLGGTGGIAIARPLGDWNLGFGASMRKSAGYNPLDANGGPVLHYQPGNEYRARVGVDHPLGTGRVTLGVTYSTFGDDNLAGSIYNTGNRYLTQLSLDNTVGVGHLTIVGWNLLRTAGTLADSTAIPHDNITDAGVSYGIPVGSATVEPNVEGRAWMQSPGVATSFLTTLGLRMTLVGGGFAFLPSVGYSFGQLAAQDAASANVTATLTGFHAMLAIRVR